MRIHRDTGLRRELTEKVTDFRAPSQRRKTGEILGRTEERYPTSSQTGTKVGRTGVRKTNNDLSNNRAEVLQKVENLKWVCHRW